MKHIISMLAGIIACANCFAESNWQINTVAYNYSGPPSVAVDSNNELIAAFTDRYPYGNLYTAKENDSNYAVTQVDGIYNAGFPKIAVTSNNEIGMVFSKNGAAWYGSKGSWFDWRLSPVTTYGAGMPDLALSSNDIPHIAHIYQTGVAAHSFYNVQTQGWACEKLGFGTSSYGYARTAIDQSGTILIAFADSRMGYIYSAICKDGSWTYLPYIRGAAYGDCSFTADGLPAIAYQNTSLHYAVYVNEAIGWVDNTIDVNCASKTIVSLGHSSTGVVGIAYVGVTNLKYATNMGGGWTTTVIDSSLAAAPYVDLIFDRNDKPVIIYNGYDKNLSRPAIKVAGIDLKFKTNFNISGHVILEDTNEPVRFVPVSCYIDSFQTRSSINTDMNGFYHFDNLPAGKIRLEVNPWSGHLGMKKEIDCTRDFNDLDLELMPGAELAGKVLDNETGEPVANVQITFTNEEYKAIQTQNSDSNGLFHFNELPPGIGRIETRPSIESGYACGPAGSGIINLEKGESRCNQLIFVEKGTLVSGRVADVNSDFLWSIAFTGTKSHGYAITDPNGNYKIRLAPGTYSIENSASNAFFKPTITVSDVNSEVNMPSITRYNAVTGAQISGQINDPCSSEKAGQFEIMVFKTDERPSAWYSEPAANLLKIEAGSFELFSLPPDSNYAVYLAITSWTPDGRKSTVIQDRKYEIAPDSNSVALTYSSAGSTVCGKVKTVDGRPVVGARVSLHSLIGRLFSGYTETDANGIYCFNNVPVRTYIISAEASRYISNSQTLNVGRGLTLQANDIIVNLEGTKEGPDLNGDGVINEIDFAAFSGGWTDQRASQCDFNNDGVVDFIDWLRITDNWLCTVIWRNGF